MSTAAATRFAAHVAAWRGHRPGRDYGTRQRAAEGSSTTPSSAGRARHRGAFYFHFAGKEEFFLHVLQARADLRDQWWLAVREAGVVDAQSGVVAALARLRDQTDGHPWLLLIADFSQAATGHHEYTEPLQALYRQWITEIASFVREMRVRGFVRDGLADDAVAEQVFATAQGYTLHRAVYGIAGQGLVDALVRILQP